MEELNYFAVYMKKIENTENDFELVTSLNPCFLSLHKDKLKQVEDIAFKAVCDIKAILQDHSK